MFTLNFILSHSETLLARSICNVCHYDVHIFVKLNYSWNFSNLDLKTSKHIPLNIYIDFDK